jgi:O-glycosyl hydrolase
MYINFQEKSFNMKILHYLIGDVIEKMINDKIFPKYLSVDFDLGWHGEKIKDRGRCMNTIKLLQNNGYNILKNTGSDYSFMYSN